MENSYPALPGNSLRGNFGQAPIMGLPAQPLVNQEGVFAELARLGDTIEFLGDNVLRLNERLGGVLQPEAPTAAGQDPISANAIGRPTSTVSDSLATKRAQIAMIATRVQRMIELLDL